MAGVVIRVARTPWAKRLEEWIRSKGYALTWRRDDEYCYQINEHGWSYVHVSGSRVRISFAHEGLSTPVQRISLYSPTVERLEKALAILMEV